MSRWHILAVVPPTFDRWAEFAVRDELTRELGLRALVPVHLGYRRVRGKAGKTINRKPIVPGYVFAEFEPEAYSSIRKVHGVRGILDLGGEWATLTQRQVDSLELLSKTQEAQIEISKFRLGDRLKIKRGALAELDGVLVMLAAGTVVADVHMLGKVHRVKARLKDVEAA